MKYREIKTAGRFFKAIAAFGIWCGCSTLHNPVKAPAVQQAGGWYTDALGSNIIEKACFPPLQTSLGQINAIGNIQDLLTVILNHKPKFRP